MGVAGAGKTTIGRALAQRLGWEFIDGDSLHSPDNIEKIRRGIPLDDADRAPWLQTIRKVIEEWIAEHRHVVLACSALKQRYREQLNAGPELKFVYLKGSSELIGQRLQSRHGHFAGLELLASQFATLEEPRDAITIDVNQSIDSAVEEILFRLTEPQ
jgi:gluconokinase